MRFLYRNFTDGAALGLDVALQILVTADGAAIAVLDLVVAVDVVRAEENQHHREKEEPVEESKDDGHGDDLEEGDEDVGLGEGEEDEGEERRDAAVQDGRPDGGEAVHGAILPRALGDDEGVRDVRGVVHAEADSDDDGDEGEGVDGHAQEVGDAHHVHHGEEHAAQDEEADAYVGEGDDDDEHDAEEGEGQVAV